MNFTCENDVRRWVREEFPDRVLWIEHKSGGTPGLTDCLILISGRLAPVELKFGVVTTGGRWAVHLRPAQLDVMRTIVRAEGEYFVLVGDTTGLWLFTFGPEEVAVRNGVVIGGVRINSGEELDTEIDLIWSI